MGVTVPNLKTGLAQLRFDEITKTVQIFSSSNICSVVAVINRRNETLLRL